jgi:chain length determinant protein tyrosine kinase EpsG
MARFRDSQSNEAEVLAPPAPPQPARNDADGGAPEEHERSIGAIISDTRNLSAEQVERILKLQREKGMRFGEAAIALGFANADDVLFALAQQFHYPYATQESRKLSPELVALNEPFSPQAEAFRGFRSQMMQRVYGDPQGRPALAVVSPDIGDGKTYFAANLAVTLAQLGGRTLLVDADLRSPRQHDVFRVANAVGLSGILSGRTESQVVQQVPGVPSLFVLPVGITPPNPVELVERPAFGLLMRELTGKFDHVIVDTPAASHGADGQVIAARCGAAVVLARKNVSRHTAVQELALAVAESTARVAGVVVNDH